MTPPAERQPSRDHYSYQHYASRDVAEGFDELRFGGPIGRYLLEWQEAVLVEALAPLAGRCVLDVGTGTGRAALGLARAGASVIGLDASQEMLGVAHRRSRDAGFAPMFARADAQALPLADRSVDAAVCLRLLMHVVDWRRCVGELCRVARHRVVIDYPSSSSVAAIEAGARRLAARAGRKVEAYRVMSTREVAAACASHGFRVAMVRHQFVLPIAAHKAIGSLAFTRTTERALAGAGLLGLFGSPVTLVVER